MGLLDADTDLRRGTGLGHIDPSHALMMWLVEEVLIRRTQGKGGAAKVIKDVLSRSANKTSRRNGGDGDEVSH